MAFIRWYERPGASRSGQVLDRLQREMNRIFSDYLAGESPMQAVPFPPVNVSEDETNLYVRAEMPGISLDDIDISVERESLTIRGLRKPAQAAEGTSFHRQEREGGRFRRIVSLPSSVDFENAAATFRDGILKIVLSKAKEAQPRQIKVARE